MHLVLKTQASEQLGGARGGCVTTDVFHLLVKVRQDFSVFRGVRIGRIGFGGKRDLNIAQLNVTIERIFKRSHFAGRRFLCDVGDHPAVRHGNVAAFSGQQPAQCSEQCGLASAVGADNADFAARINGEGGALYQGHRAAGEGKIN